MSTSLVTTVSPAWLLAGMGGYALTAVVAGAGEALRKPAFARAGFWLLLAAFVFNAAMIGLMWANLDRPPFKTLYETFLLYPFCIALVSLVLVQVHRLSLLVPFAAAGALLCFYQAWRRPDLELVVLPPALQSAWFVPHVVTYFIAYAGLFVSFVLAALSLFKARGQRGLTPISGSLEIGCLSPLARTSMPLPLEAAAHKAVMFGFAALTLGLAMGAAWGKSAWGDYWQWDPKENWAFITWLAYLSYLHLRLIGNWRGKRALWVNLVCFAAVMFTYLGMNLLPKAVSSGSLHLYQ